MVARRSRFCFLFEPLHQVGIACGLWRQNLDRHRAAQPGVVSAVNLAHAANPDH
jgi:hypothetical protein